MSQIQLDKFPFWDMPRPEPVAETSAPPPLPPAPSGSSLVVKGGLLCGGLAFGALAGVLCGFVLSGLVASPAPIARDEDLHRELANLRKEQEETRATLRTVSQKVEKPRVVPGGGTAGLAEEVRLVLDERLAARDKKVIEEAVRPLETLLKEKGGKAPPLDAKALADALQPEISRVVKAEVTTAVGVTVKGEVRSALAAEFARKNGPLKDLQAKADALAAATTKVNKEGTTAVREAAGEAVKDGLGKVADAVAATVEGKVSGPVRNLQSQTVDLAARLDGLAAQLGRQSARQDVALVLYNARTVHAGQTHAALKGVLDKPFWQAYPGHRLGVFVARNDAVDHTLWGLDKPAPEPPVAITESTDGSETVADLDPQKAIFEGAKSPTEPWQRRCVVVVSSACEAPPADAPKWKDIAVDVVLVEKPGLALTPKRWDDWKTFCASHRGVAVPFRAGEDGKPDPAAFAAVVGRLIQPLETTPK